MFSNSMDNIPRINDFKDAAYTWSTIKPVRTWATNERPLRARREQHKVLRQYHDSYAARLYRTDMVTYWEDGRVSITRDDHQMSKAFVDAVAPQGLFATGHLGEMFITARVNHTTNHMHYQPKHGQTLHFKRVGYTSMWELLNPEDCIRHEKVTVNREKSKVVREALKPLVNWMNAVNTVATGDVAPVVGTLDTMPSVHTVTDELKLNLLDGAIAPERYPLFMAYLAKGRWSRASLGGGVERRLYLPHNWKDSLTNLSYRALEVFDREPIPLGELPSKSRWK